MIFRSAPILITITAFLLPLAGLRAQDSARAALGILEQKAGGTEAANVVAVVGFNGKSQPVSWKILVKINGNDQILREYIVQKRQLLGPTVVQRTADVDLPKTPLLLSALRIDSPEAFRIADDVAIANGVGFDQVNYQLRWRGNDVEPTWLTTLIDSHGKTAGSIYVTANTGTVAHQNFSGATAVAQNARPPKGLTPVSANAAQGPPRAVVSPVAPAPQSQRQPQPQPQPQRQPQTRPAAKPEPSSAPSSSIWLLNPAKRRARSEPAPQPQVPSRYRPR
ncbi:MAG: hypothetical protein ACI8UO_000088 [Verrucomicrobiales bacterium]|jgi:hypothetical protein